MSTPSPHIRYINGRLHVDNVDVASIAREAGTPVYVYAASEIRDRFRTLSDALKDLNPLLCYALKANGNLHICRMLAELGAGMDVVSGGELERAWLSGAAMSNVTFAGVGKTEDEIRAALDGRHSPLIGRIAGRDPTARGMVGRFNAESEQECERIARIAGELGVRARVSLRVNPDVDAKTHKYTTTGKKENKFGVDIERGRAIFERFRDHPSLALRGIHLHLGSPIAETTPFVEGTRAALALIDELETIGVKIDELNLGGGFGIDYGRAKPATLEEFGAALAPMLKERVKSGLKILLEPGRPIVGNSGVLIARVQYIKRGRAKTFVITDTGMHQLLRPALYEAYHFVWPTCVEPAHVPADMSERQNMQGLDMCDVVGPICESSDFLALDRAIPPMNQGDLIAAFSAGAYGMSMANTYNDHPRPAEVLADNGHATIIRPRQEMFDLVASELEAPQRIL